MERLQFIKNLKNNLVARGFPESVVDAEMVTVKSYLEENGLKDVEVSVDEMAEEIAEMLSSQEGESAETEAPASADAAEEPLPDSASMTAPEDIAENASPSIDEEISSAMVKIRSVKNKAAEKKASDDRVFDDLIDDIAPDNKAKPDSEGDDDVKVFSGSKDIKKAPASNDDEEPFEDDISYVDSDEDYRDYMPGGAGKKKSGSLKEYFGKVKKLFGKLVAKISGKEVPETEEKTKVAETAKSKAADSDSQIGENYDDGKLDGLMENYENNKVLFWVVFAIALPVVILLSLFMVALYIAFWIILAVVMIAIVALLIAFVTAGVIVALVGIVYGTIQLIKGLTPVGMFEIGLGITVGAAVMFIGIIVYNIAIRLIPFCMRMLAKLLAFAFRKGKDGFVALKGVLDRI